MATIKETPMLNKALSIIFVVGMSVSSWFLNETMGKIKDMEHRVYTLEIDNAKTLSSKFTAKDFVEQKQVIDAQILASDRRILVLEESQKQIKEILFEIREDLKELKERAP